MSEYIQINNISKKFFGVQALTDVSLALEKGTVTGLVGENGAGKSTLMNILGGVHQPDSGTITLNGKPYHPRNPMDAKNAAIAFIHQELNLYANLSIVDNIFINNFPKFKTLPFINKKAAKAKTIDLLRQVDLNYSPNTPVGNLAPGEKQLVEIAKAFSFGAQIIIFDEPTTSLTSKETERLFKLIMQLREEEKTIIYISHILYDVVELCDTIAVMRNGRIVNSGAKKDYTIPKMISYMIGRDIDHMFPRRKGRPLDDALLNVTKVSQPGIVKSISFDLKRGEILGVYGLMGSGRSELANIIFGLEPFEEGKISTNGQSTGRRTPAKSIIEKMAFLTENRRDEGLLMDASISENMILVSLDNYTDKLGKLKQSAISSVVDETSAQLKIKKVSLKQHVLNLSGGNQQKVVIGKWLIAHPNIFILDEPTRGIDVGAKYEVYSLINELADNGTGILFISSEVDELLGICDRILVMSNGELISEFEKTNFVKEKIIASAFREN